MRIERFEDLVTWQKARALALEVYRASDGRRFSRDFGLKDQIRRAAVSVMSNIAEGFGRYGAAEVNRFLSIALGSSAEVRCQLYLAKDLGYITEPERKALAERCIEVDRLMNSFRSALRHHSHRTDP